MKKSQRIPEGGAILDEKAMTTDEYGANTHALLADQYRRFAENACKSLSIPEGGRVLEIGSGPGWAGFELLKLRPDITLTGLEPSPDMIRTAQNNAEKEGLGTRCAYIEGFVEAIPGTLQGKFDAVISRDSLHHWADTGKGFTEINRVLSENGKAYISDCKQNLSLGEWLIVTVFGKKMAGPMLSGWKSSIRASYTAEEIRKQLAGAGLPEWKAEASFLNLTVTDNKA